MLNKMVFLICFVFSFTSRANHLDSGVDINSDISKCQSTFGRSFSIDSVLHENGFIPLKTRATKDYWHEHLNETIVLSAFMEEVQFKQQFPATWKKDVLESLPILDTAQILDLVENIKKLKNENGIISEQTFFQAFVAEIIQIIPKFDKQGLIEILYAFSSMEMTVTDKFVRAWRKRALELKRTFHSFEQYYLSSLFRKLGVSPLKDPYNMDSDNVESNPKESMSSI